MLSQATTHMRAETALNTSTIFSSFQPHISKWWWMGAILNSRLPWVARK